MDIQRLTNEHSTAALRFALLASVAMEAATPAELQARDEAQEAATDALARVLRHLPASSTELRLQADYIAARLDMGDTIDPSLLRAHFRALSMFNLPRQQAAFARA